MTQPRCGTRAAVVAHLEFGEALDGPCAAYDAAMRLEAERWRPVAPPKELSPAERLELLNVQAAAWELEHDTRSKARLRAVPATEAG